MTDPMIGRTLGRDGFIEITGRLGEGGMGAVYRATDHKRNRDLAVKFLTPDLSGDPDVIARFTREGKRFAGLEHPNVARVHGLGKEQGMLYIVAEFIDGHDVRKHVKTNGNPTAAESLRIAREIASGVAAAHERGIVHRDLKPENVMLRRADNSICVLDFGIAKDLESTTVLTAPGMYIGTVGYAAPEQIRGDEIDERVDIFALGVMLYELLTGQMAFEGKATQQILRATLDERQTPVRKLNDEAGGPVSRLVDSMLQKKPRKRIASMNDVVTRITEIEQNGIATETDTGIGDRLKRLFGGG